MRRCSAWVTGLCVMTICAVNVYAGNFNDPLSQPASPSDNLVHSRLMGVTGNRLELIAVGPMGHILMSANQGKDWTQVQLPLSTDLVAVRFLGEHNVWAVGHDGVILHSTDSGRSWVRQLDGNQILTLLREQLDRLGQPADENGMRFKSELERAIADGAAKPIFDIAFLDKEEGFAVGPFNLALHTVDGGLHWQPIGDLTANPDGLHLYGLTVASGKLWMVGERGLVRYWDSNESRFKPVETPYQGSFFGIVGGHGTLVAFGMMGRAVRSTDGGRSWSLINTGASGAITAGAQMPDGRIVLVTLAGELLVGDAKGDGFRLQPVDKPMPYFSVAPAGAGRVALTGAQGVRVESLM